MVGLLIGWRTSWMKLKFEDLVNLDDFSYDELNEYPTLNNVNSGRDIDYRITVKIVDYYENLICSLNNFM